MNLEADYTREPLTLVADRSRLKVAAALSHVLQPPRAHARPHSGRVSAAREMAAPRSRCCGRCGRAAL
jgi:hypothetical protein